MLQELDSDLSRHFSGNKRMSLLIRSKVARTLKFHNVMTHSIINHYSKVKSIVEKRHIASALSSKLIQRYRLRSAVARTLGLSAAQRVLTKKIIAENTNRFKIEAFFLSDDVSRNTAGTKETVTRKKIKKQKRYLLSSMKTLYKKFILLNGDISYTTFTRYRPFYVLKPTELSRETCLCKQHTNVSLLAAKLRQINVIPDKDPHVLYKLAVCDKLSEKCMYNLCDVCK